MSTHHHHRRRRGAALAATLLASVVLAACGDDDGDDAAAEPAVTTAPAPTTPAADPTTTGATGPATTAAPGSTAEAPGEVPARIVSLSPSATETLFAIGAGDLVVAIDDQSDFPAEVASLPNDLSGYQPNVEAIAAYEPDLVIHDGTTELGAQLATLGIDDLVDAVPQSFDDIYVRIEEIGAVTGRSDEAAELVEQMQSDIEAAVEGVPELDIPPTYYHELDPSYFSVTSNTFIGQVYGLFGLRNIADSAEGGTDYPQLSAEFVISQDPDMIFLADTECCEVTAESVAARPGWDAIGAVGTGNVIEASDDVASRWGPRVVDHVELVADAVRDVASLSAG